MDRTTPALLPPGCRLRSCSSNSQQEITDGAAKNTRAGRDSSTPPRAGSPARPTTPGGDQVTLQGGRRTPLIKRWRTKHRVIMRRQSVSSESNSGTSSQRHKSVFSDVSSWESSVSLPVASARHRTQPESRNSTQTGSRPSSKSVPSPGLSCSCSGMTTAQRFSCVYPRPSTMS